jgi:hypothetical protein
MIQKSYGTVQCFAPTLKGGTVQRFAPTLNFESLELRVKSLELADARLFEL